MLIKPVLNYNCDVLVVGGGPAGSSVAAHLAKHDVQVIVLEAKVFPRDKVCGDAVSPLAIKELQELGITELDGFKNGNEITRATIFIDDQEITDIDLPGTEGVPFHSKVIPRLKMDNWIHQQAIKNGAEYLEEHRLVSYKVSDSCVVATVSKNGITSEIKTKLIIGADGSNSTVARAMYGSKPPLKSRLLALRAYFEDIEGPADLAEIYFSKDNFPGLYWVFPTSSKSANIGLGMVAETVPRRDGQVNSLLANHIESSPNLKKRIGKGRMVGKIQGWPLTMYNPKNPIVSDRVLLVGDAAGLINALSGDGVQYALQSGRWASDCIVKCLAYDDFSTTSLSRYQHEVTREIGLDFAVADVVVQFGRNKAFQNIWMRLLRVLLERAKIDRDYGRVIGGIFGGTYPTYHVFKLKFIFKTLMQGGMHLGMNSIASILSGPEEILTKFLEGSNSMTNAMELVSSDGNNQMDWINGIAGKSGKVSSLVIKKVAEKSVKSRKIRKAT